MLTKAKQTLKSTRNEEETNVKKKKNQEHIPELKIN